MKRSAKDYALLMIRGIAMGAADVVPGVSGGTIAFITGIYDELLHSLGRCGPGSLVVLFRQGIPAFWRHINGNFLLAVFGGILLSVKTFASIISFCLENYPVLVWAFFTGLIAASVVLLLKTQTSWRWRDWGACLLGAIFVIAISVAKPAHLPGEWWIVFLGGFVAICAMILPGISGSFILLLAGLYPVVLNAVNDMEFGLLASFMGGCICGLLVFSRFLSWLLDNYHQTTLAVLIGFLIGSLNVTWPWKVAAENVAGDEFASAVQMNVSPFSYEDFTGLDPQVALVFASAIVGLLLVLSIELLAVKFSKD